MMMAHKDNVFIIPISIIVAFLLTLLPMPAWAIWLRPAWVLLTLMYWAMVMPDRVNVGTAWLAGVFLDAVEGTLLGQHALALVMVIYLVARLSNRLWMFPLAQQGLSVFFLVLIYQFILYCIQGFLGVQPATWFYWASSLTSMLVWPWLYSILRGRTETKIV